MAYQSTSRGFAPFLGALVGLLVLAIADDASATIIRYETSLGDVDVRLYDTATPNSVTNFLNYVTSNRYDGTFIHRVPQAGGSTQNFVVQGGGFKLNNSIFAAEGIVTDAPIADEPGITNIRGSLAFAKNNLGATSQWFFNIGDNSFLDTQDFTVFGRVLGDGMDVVDAINNLTTANASSAETPDTGEDFDEVPVTDINQVISQNDITAAEAVMVNDVRVIGFSAGDYNRNGFVDMGDLALWKQDFGSTILAEADGDGNGVVDAADYTVWRDFYLGNSIATTVPEPTTIGLLLLGLAGIPRRKS